MGIGSDTGHRPHDGLYFLTEIFVWDAEHSCISDLGMRNEQVMTYPSAVSTGPNIGRSGCVM